jgi:hypothetical protein
MGKLKISGKGILWLSEVVSLEMGSTAASAVVIGASPMTWCECNEFDEASNTARETHALPKHFCEAELNQHHTADSATERALEFNL